MQTIRPTNKNQTIVIAAVVAAAALFVLAIANPLSSLRTATPAAQVETADARVATAGTISSGALTDLGSTAHVDAAGNWIIDPGTTITRVAGASPVPTGAQSGPADLASAYAATYGDWVPDVIANPVAGLDVAYAETYGGWIVDPSTTYTTTTSVRLGTSSGLDAGAFSMAAPSSEAMNRYAQAYGNWTVDPNTTYTATTFVALETSSGLGAAHFRTAK